MMHDLPVDSDMWVRWEAKRVEHFGPAPFRTVLEVIERGVVVTELLLTVRAICAPGGNYLAG